MRNPRGTWPASRMIGRASPLPRAPLRFANSSLSVSARSLRAFVSVARLKIALQVGALLASSMASSMALSACSTRQPTEPSQAHGAQQIEAAKSSTEDGSVRAAGNSVRAVTTQIPLIVPVLVGTFPASTQVPAQVGKGSSTTDALHTPIKSLRATLPPKQDVEPLPRDVTRLLSIAADAIGKNNLQAALDATEEAEQLAPDRVEPLEIRLVALLSRGGSSDVRTVLDAISARDPSNAVGIAFRGLIAAQAGRDAEALALFALFLGDGAIERRGVAIPLPTEPGELEELAAACALRLQYADAALEAITEAKRARATDGKALRRIGLLESDALVMLGRHDEACSVLRGLIPSERALAARAAEELKPINAIDGTNSTDTTSTSIPSDSSVQPLDEFAMLALLRLDLIEVARGRVEDRLRDALNARQLAQRSDFAL